MEWSFSASSSLWLWTLRHDDTDYSYIALRPWPGPYPHPYQLYIFDDLGEPITLGYYGSLEEAKAEAERRLTEFLSERKI